MPSQPEKSALYTERHYVRKFLLQYARPSMLEELLDVLADEPNDKDEMWALLIRGVHMDLIGG